MVEHRSIQVSGSCNVNWQSYAPGGEDAGSMDMISSAGRLLAYFVVLFPVIDVTSVYPLNVMVSSTSHSIIVCPLDVMVSSTFHSIIASLPWNKLRKYWNLFCKFNRCVE